MNEEYPISLREKALAGLVRFNDPALVPQIIVLLENPKNYHLYGAILNLVNHFDKDGRYQETLRRMAYQAHQGGNSNE